MKIIRDEFAYDNIFFNVLNIFLSVCTSLVSCYVLITM